MVGCVPACVCFVMVISATDCRTVGTEQSSLNKNKLSSKCRPALSEPSHYFPQTRCRIFTYRLLNHFFCVRLALQHERRTTTDFHNRQTLRSTNSQTVRSHTRTHTNTHGYTDTCIQPYRLQGAGKIAIQVVIQTLWRGNECY